MAQQVLYVNPEKGRDNQTGLSPSQPLQSITAAVRLSQSDTLIQLKAGLYTTNSGEQFPLTIPTQCEVVGEMTGDRPASIIQGGGLVQSALLGAQSVACRLQDGATLRNVMVINTQSGGTGVWLGAGRPQLKTVTVMHCPQYGAVAVEKAIPTMEDCIFESCQQAGVAFLNQSKGQCERIYCRKNQTGLLIKDAAAPLLMACSIEQNTVGIAVTDDAHPILRRSRVCGNQTVGIRFSDQAIADLGQPQDVGDNIVRNNGVVDIDNATRRSLMSCGNDVLPQRLRGKINLVASEIPDPSAVPPTLFDQAPSFQPQEPAPPAEPPSPEPPATVHFSDIRNHWAAPFIEGLLQAGTVAGFRDGTFRPNRTVTRAEFAALVVANFPDQPLTESPVQFRDLSPDFWGYTALTTAQRMGFLNGFPDGTIRPNDSMTRIQAIVAIANGLNLSGGRADDLSIYRDRAQIPSYAVDALAAATQRRLVVNYPEPLVLRPPEPITRGELAALIYQGRVVVGTANAIVSPYIVRPDTTQPLFSDLQNHWAADFIRGLASANLVSGMLDGRFAPDEPMSRAQFATLIVKAFQPPSRRSATAFSDVPPNHWGAATIQSAYQSEFMTGFPDRTFAPEHPLLRVQTWVSLVGGLQWEIAEQNLQLLSRFTDYIDIPRYALRATAIALDKQLIVNYPNQNQLRPNQVATRAEVCATVYQALVSLGRLPAISSQHIA